MKGKSQRHRWYFKWGCMRLGEQAGLSNVSQWSSQMNPPYNSVSVSAVQYWDAWSPEGKHKAEQELPRCISKCGWWWWRWWWDRLSPPRNPLPPETNHSLFLHVGHLPPLLLVSVMETELMPSRLTRLENSLWGFLFGPILKRKGDDVRNTLFRPALPRVSRRLQKTKADAALPQLL